MTQEEIQDRMDECPWCEKSTGEPYVCTRYFGTLVPCNGACSFVVDYTKLKEFETRKNEENISTTIEQSKKLLSLGIKPETANMYYFQNIDSDYFPPDKEWYSQVAVKDNRFNLKYDIPAWSLSALLRLMPSKIKDSTLFLRKYDDVYCCGYTDLIRTGDYIWYYERNPIDAAVEMIEWLVTNKYLKV